MSELKTPWTPGPWRAISNGFTQPAIAKLPTQTLAIESAGPIICELWTPKRNRDRVAGVAEIYANEHLIAAAPDLYAALSKAREWMEERRELAEFVPELAAAITALAKARGEA